MRLNRPFDLYALYEFDDSKPPCGRPASVTTREFDRTQLLTTAAAAAAVYDDDAVYADRFKTAFANVRIENGSVRNISSRTCADLYTVCFG